MVVLSRQCSRLELAVADGLGRRVLFAPYLLRVGQHAIGVECTRHALISNDNDNELERDEFRTFVLTLSTRRGVESGSRHF